MRFYTNVQMIGNKFLVRGYENGEHVMFKEEYSPTLFVRSNKESKYKTLEPFLMGYTKEDSCMMSSEKILTLVIPTPTLLEKYQDFTKE